MIRQEQCDKVCRILDNYLYNRPTERDSLIVAVQKAFEALEGSKWVLCSERLPNKFEDVWVTDNRGRVAVCHRGHSGWRDAESDDWMYHLDSIVAWMPYYVPEPYQEGEH